MAKFKLVAAAQPRFEDDFAIVVEGDNAPAPNEKAYLEGVTAALDWMAEEESRDVAFGLAETLRDARRQARQKFAAAVKADAAKFCVDRLAAQEALAHIADLEAHHRAWVAKFATKDRASARFEGDFDVAAMPDYEPTDAEQTYLDKLAKAVDELAADEAKDAAGDFSESVIKARQVQRTKCAKELRAQLARYVATQNAGAAVEQLLMSMGGYHSLRDRLTRRLFAVATIGEATKKDEQLTVDLRIGLKGGLPAPENEASPAKEELFVQLNKASTVIKTVCQRTDERADRGWWRSDAEKERIRARTRHLRDEYMRKLRGIAVIGLEQTHTALARAALTELRNEFFAQEAGRIKKNYVRLLGIWAGLATLLLLVAFAFVRTDAMQAAWPWWYEHKSFLLAAAGAAAGAWLSFSIRQVQLTFDDLVMLEEDSLDPPLRVVFVVGLTLTLCLLFWTKALNIEIGSLNTGPASFKETGTIAFLIGLFCGLSERALATAISGRAAAFVRGAGSGG